MNKRWQGFTLLGMPNLINLWGTAESGYVFQDFMAMVNILPWVVRMTFEENTCVGIEKIDLFGKAAESRQDLFSKERRGLGRWNRISKAPDSLSE